MNNSNINVPKNSIPSKISYIEISEVYNKMLSASNINNSLYGFDIILHDGPPYANGNLHIGNLFNKILKDFVARGYVIRGKKVCFIHGSDCHGLPIEQEVLKQSNNIEKTDIISFRKKCREYVEEQIANQMKQIQKQNILVFNDKYYTMDFNYCANILQTLFGIYERGLILREYQPIYYSFEEQTNLAFSEITYKDITHSYVYCCFSLDQVANTYIVIYTTQAWTLFGNAFICINSDIDYVISEYEEKSIITSRKFATENNLQIIDSVSAEWILRQKYSSEFLGIKSYNIFNAKEEVSEEIGAGILHCAPAHGYEDYAMSKKFLKNYQIKNCISIEGNILDSRFKEYKVHKNASKHIIELLKEEGLVVKSGDLLHKYPVSWRSKRPVYTIATEQITINLNKSIINDVINKVDEVNWYGTETGNTLKAMLKSRSESWCISRQRYWGVPCMFFINKKTREIVYNEKIKEAIINTVKNQGYDFWYNKEFMDNFIYNYVSKDGDIDYLSDTLDIWFDSGSSFINLIDFVNKKYNHKIHKADYYIEGRDQHRGWFQTSALVTNMILGRLPYKNVLVHGFIKTKTGNKISKSDKSTRKISDQIEETYIEILRMLMFSANYGKDVMIDQCTIQSFSYSYKKAYNTLRYFINTKYLLNEKTVYKNSIINDYFVYKVNEFADSYDSSYAEKNFGLAYKSIVELIKIISDFIDIYRLYLYCEKTDSEILQQSLVVIEYMFYRLSYMLYPICPATVCYMFKDDLNSEVDVVQKIDKKMSNKINIKSYNKDIIEMLYAVYGENISIDASKNSGLIIPDKLEEYLNEFSIFIRTSCCFTKGGVPSEIDQSKLHLFKYKGQQFEFFKAKEVYSICERCRRYNTLSGLCLKCSQH